MTFILIVELGIAVSIYAYKNRLADGFEKGLAIGMNDNDPQRNIDIYWVQRNVCHHYDINLFSNFYDISLIIQFET